MLVEGVMEKGKSFACHCSVISFHKLTLTTDEQINNTQMIQDGVD